VVSRKIPAEVVNVVETLEQAGFEAYLVGGCVRDLIMEREPKDWDVATDAVPEEIEKVFSDQRIVFNSTGPTASESVIATKGPYETIYENRFGTVGIKTGSRDPALKIVEVTTFRIEGKYTDKRHPDEVKFAKTVEEDLSRRDFTVNAMALRIGIKNKELRIKERPEPKAHNSQFILLNSECELIDPYGGQEDLKQQVIRTVGDPSQRFTEDALRLMRAVRFATELGNFSARGGPASGWQIDFDTRRAIEAHAGLLEMIAKERIRDEFEKMLMTPRAAAGVILLEELDLLRYVLPELREGLGVTQNKHHIYTVFEHNVRALEYSAKQDYSFEVRLASLLHDVGKPKTKQGDGPNSTFYNHEVVGAKLAARALDRLRFSKDRIEYISHLIRYHMFYYNVGEVTEAGVRRFLRRVGPESVPDLIKLREADRIGSGVPKAVPYKLRHFLFMIEKVKHDPVSVKMLKVNGTDIMETLSISPSPKVGQILAVLLEEVLDDPSRNEKEHLLSCAKALAARSEEELVQLAQEARQKKDAVEDEVEVQMKKQYHVQ
jgi:poly(A) polymerase/tRNA nucleotidyltransferase (CCA-adding enzyme)